jgi:thiamine kinase-like enzyme
MDEERLRGGISNAGGVVRVGPHVLRPSNPHSAAIHEFLSALRAAGFDGASAPIGIDLDGRERLVFIEGQAPGPPYPIWAQTDAALASIATLMSGMHEASRSFDPTGLQWSPELADPNGGPIVGHNDVALDNVIFRDGLAVGLIDFDFAAPGRTLYDLAHLARLCVPIDDDETSSMLGWAPADRPARLRLVADSYGLATTGRAQLTEMLSVSLASSKAFVRGRVEAGDPNFNLMWDFMGGAGRFDRRDRWWADHRDRFAAALR